MHRVNWIKIYNPIDYNEFYATMEKKVHEVIEFPNSETIYLLEHTETYTAGTNYKDEELIDTKDIPVIYTGRGGKFTYHNPGQRVIYPILNLSNHNRTKDLKLYVRMLEEWVITTLKAFDIEATSSKERIGIWVKYKNEARKIASIGVRIKKWVTFHGIAINVSNDLKGFHGIIPCGLKGFKMISLKEMGLDVSLNDFDIVLEKEFHKIFC
jgi:lipoyl(octanoyl) transferase